MKKVIAQAALAATLAASAALPTAATAGTDPYIGEINYVAFNFAPRNWKTCDGQLLSISSNTALYSLLGTTYGGDGRSTFALPDMRGRVPVHQGTGPGLSTYVLGARGGFETITLTLAQLPAHNHDATAQSTSAVTGGAVTSELNVNNGAGSTTPDGNYLAGNVGGRSMYNGATPNATLNAASISSDLSGVQIATQTSVSVQANGGSQPMNNRQPFLTVTCVISLDGIFPSRS